MGKKQQSPRPNSPAAKAAASANSLVKEPAEQPTPDTGLAEFKYIGDDGKRWVFERREDGLCVTIDKPTIKLTGKSGRLSAVVTVQGFHVHDEAIALCKK